MNQRLQIRICEGKLVRPVLPLLMSLCLAVVECETLGYTVLHSFGTNVMGLRPAAGLTQGPDGLLYGTTRDGGAFNRGQVFKVKTDGADYTILKDFTGPDGQYPNTRLLLSGSTLYGTTEYGVWAGLGTIFRVETNGTGFAVLKQFTGADGQRLPLVELVSSGSVLYGGTRWNSTGDFGTVFRLNTNGSDFTVLKSFTPPDYPSALVLSGSTLYGSSHNPEGPLFKLNTDGSGFAFIKASEPFSSEGALLLSGSTLYGTGWGKETEIVYKVNTDGSGFTVLKYFNYLEGSPLRGGLVLSEATLYGTAEGGGSNGASNGGTLFKLNTDGSGFTVLAEFTTDSEFGYCPQPGLILSGTTLYGTASDGGFYASGTVFKIQTDGSNFKPIVNFVGGDGSLPLDVTVSEGVLYGITEGGGGRGAGTVFRMNTNGSGYTVLKDFTNSLEGQLPQSLLIAGATLYGCTGYSPGGDGGTVFSLNKDGTGYTELKQFTDPSEGIHPTGDLVLSGAALYGMTDQGGLFGYGTLFRMSTNGSAFTVLRSFTREEGPPSALVLSGNIIYGTTWPVIGDTGAGTLFRIGTNGADFTVLKDFSGSDAIGPDSLLLSGSTLYGIAGGGSGYGTVFKINTDGTGLQVYAPFNWGAGSHPRGRLWLLGSTLFGTCEDGLFQIETDGTGYALFQRFPFAGDGPAPYSPRAMALSDLAVFVATGMGGYFGGGAVLTLSLAPGVDEIPPDRTVEAGGSISFFMQPTGAWPSGVGWLHDGANLVPAVATNFLELGNPGLEQSGRYSLAVTNAYGSCTSAPVTLNVIPAVERRSVPGIKVSGGLGQVWRVESADSLGLTAGWEALGTLTLGELPSYCFDLSRPLPATRFYRASRLSTEGDPAVLAFGRYPALTVTGPTGSSVRIDSIKPVGPTDAWLTLDTVTLTNTSQLYFDVSPSGQTDRLYRLVPLL